eukprot:6184009-Pleurochrysis_carterae.AAC.6
MTGVQILKVYVLVHNPPSRRQAVGQNVRLAQCLALNRPAPAAATRARTYSLIYSAAYSHARVLAGCQNASPT